jgi:membrane protein DedA with SNARE-associated domain
VGIFVLLVPALLVVVLGYAVGYAVWEAAVGTGAEAAGWVTGLVLLVVVVWVLLRVWRKGRGPLS